MSSAKNMLLKARAQKDISCTIYSCCAKLKCQIKEHGAIIDHDAVSIHLDFSLYNMLNSYVFKLYDWKMEAPTYKNDFPAMQGLTKNNLPSSEVLVCIHPC
jgi:hypothetical protein